MGRGAARGVRRVPRAHRRRAARRAERPAASTMSARRGRARVATSSAGASSSWSASPASTAIPTAPSRSRCAPATPAWRWSTRASASRRPRSSNAALETGVHVVGLSILSGSHVPLVAEVGRAHARGGARRRAGRRRRHHPARDGRRAPQGSRPSYTPKDFELTHHGRHRADRGGRGGAAERLRLSKPPAPTFAGFFGPRDRL